MIETVREVIGDGNPIFSWKNQNLSGTMFKLHVLSRIIQNKITEFRDKIEVKAEIFVYGFAGEVLDVR